MNEHIVQRLAGLQKVLLGQYEASISLSSSMKGAEREQFIRGFLSKVFPPIYRFGTGDVTDAKGKKSGQLDVVIEYPFAPSLPMIGDSDSRLYLAEGVAAVIEVKSNIADQWEQAKKTAQAVSPLMRNFGPSFSLGSGPAKSIPVYSVGYAGWENMDTLERKLSECSAIDGILVINRGLYLSKTHRFEGPLALWGFICDLHRVTNSLQASAPDTIAYARRSLLEYDAAALSLLDSLPWLAREF